MDRVLDLWVGDKYTAAALAPTREGGSISRARFPPNLKSCINCCVLCMYTFVWRIYMHSVGLVGGFLTDLQLARFSMYTRIAHLLLRMVSGTMSLTAAGPRTSPAAARGLGRWPGFFT